MKAGFATHPAHPGTMADFGEDEEAQYELINDVEGSQVCKFYTKYSMNDICFNYRKINFQYYFPTPGDSDTLRPGNLADNTLDDVRNNPRLPYSFN